MARPWRSAVLCLLLAWLFALLAPAAVVQAASPVVVAGHVANGTPGGRLPGGLRVYLRPAQEAPASGAPEAAVAPDGSFRVTADGLKDDAEYVAAVEVDGVEYASQPFRPTAAPPDAAITVYDSTTDSGALRIRSHTLLVAGATPQPPQLRLLELLAVENTGQRTFISRPGGAGGPMGLLRFALPPGANDLVGGAGLQGAQLLQVDRGFAALTAILPGRRDLSFAYQVPYTADSASLPRSVIYPTDLFRVLWRRGSLEVRGEGLAPQADVDIGGARYGVAVAQGLAAGSHLELRVSGLPLPPAPWPWERREVLRWLVLAPAAAALAVGLALALHRARHPVAQPARSTEELLAWLVALDQAHQVGVLDARRYERERAAAKRQLMALMRRQEAATA